MISTSADWLWKLELKASLFTASFCSFYIAVAFLLLVIVCYINAGCLCYIGRVAGWQQVWWWLFNWDMCRLHGELKMVEWYNHLVLCLLACYTRIGELGRLGDWSAINGNQWLPLPPHQSLNKDGRATDSCFALIGVHQCNILMVDAGWLDAFISTTR